MLKLDCTHMCPIHLVVILKSRCSGRLKIVWKQFDSEATGDCLKWCSGQIVHVPNATLASTTVENLSRYDDRRGRFALLLCPNQSTKVLDDIQRVVAEAFKQPAVANWQQYLQLPPSNSKLQAVAKEAGPTQLWHCGFVDVDTAGALVFEIVFCVPHSDARAFKRVRHEAFVAVLRVLERAGVRHSSHREYVGSP